MHPSINNLAFTTPTTTTTNNNNNNHNPNHDSSSYHPINSPCIFYEDDTFLQLLHDMPHKHSTPIVAHYQSSPNMKIHSTITNSHSQTPTGVLIKGYSPENDFHCHNLKKIARDRSSKKDRHRKINTVQGPRYPRVRLSRDVAKNFFGLQDMLGFDKASKTVEWLLTKSDTAIKQLIINSTRAHNVSSTNTNGASSTSISSECEILSGIVEDSPLSILWEVTMVDKAKQEAGREKKTVINRARAFGSLEKETRERARARARERTVEKKIKLGNGNYYIKNVPYADIIDQNNDQHSRSWSMCPQS